MLLGLGASAGARPAPRVKETKVGDTFRTCCAEPDNERDIRTKNWTVIEIYPYFALCRSGSGERKCFNYGDLVMLGKENCYV